MARASAKWAASPRRSTTPSGPVNFRWRCERTGPMGTREMSATSDLDLMTLYRAADPAAESDEPADNEAAKAADEIGKG